MSSKEPKLAISAHQNDIHEADLAEASQLIDSLQIEDSDDSDAKVRTRKLRTRKFGRKLFRPPSSNPKQLSTRTKVPSQKPFQWKLRR